MHEDGGCSVVVKFCLTHLLLRALEAFYSSTGGEAWKIEHPILDATRFSCEPKYRIIFSKQRSTSGSACRGRSNHYLTVPAQTDAAADKLSTVVRFVRLPFVSHACTFVSRCAWPINRNVVNSRYPCSAHAMPPNFLAHALARLISCIIACARTGIYWMQ